MALTLYIDCDFIDIVTTLSLKLDCDLHSICNLHKPAFRMKGYVCVFNYIFSFPFKSIPTPFGYHHDVFSN
jgi:hypothetical protein